MNTLSIAIEDAVNICLDCGRGAVDLNDNVTVSAEWEPWEEDSRFTIIVVYIIEKGVIKFRYPLVDTKVES